MKLIRSVFVWFVFLGMVNIQAWQNVITLSPEWNDSSVPCFAFDGSGNGILEWRLFDGNYTRVQVSRYTELGTSWSSTQTISPVGQAREPKLVVNNTGNAVALWRLLRDSNFAVQSSFYTASTQSWQIPFYLPLISDSLYNAEIPNIAFNNANKAVACWQLYDGTTWVVQASAGDASQNWTTPTTVSITGFYGFSPEIVMTDNAVPTVSIVFYGIMEPAGKDCVQYVRSTDGGSTWSVPIVLSTSGVSAYAPKIAIDGAGNLIVVWQEVAPDGSWSIQARKFESGSWLDIKTLYVGIFLNASRCPNVCVAMNDNGQAVVTWFTTQESCQKVQAVLYDGSDWNSWNSQVVDISGTFVPVNKMDWPCQNVAIDPMGNAGVVWQQYDNVGNSLIHVSLYTVADNSWKESILSEPGQDATLPYIAFSPKGKACVTWKRTNGKKLGNPINQIQICLSE
jgi:hypothetical protein